ncbi:MAG: hypothetical protein IPF79_05840 [Ignavibacteria bacterium]|nr:hypothetical protein [Ignavibacteria bacterium]
MTFRTLLTTPVDPDAVGAPFYLDVLRENGVEMDAITIDSFLYRDEELEELCWDIVESTLVATYLSRSEELLTRYPTNALVLLSIAEAGATDEASLRAALALRELSRVLLQQERDVPLDTETKIEVCCAGAEVLFQFLLWLDLSEMVLPMLLEKVKLVPHSRDYLVMSAFRSAAVCDITREEDEGGSFYSEMRSIFAKVYSEDPDLMWEVHLADAVRTFIFDGPDDEGLDSMIATITAAPFTDDQQFSIDRYLDVEPVLKDLFDRFHQPPTPPPTFEASPAKDLQRLIARQNFTSADEARDFIKQYMDKPVPVIPEEDLTDDERAEDAVEAVLHTQTEFTHSHLLALVAAYPTSLWPWVGLARTADSSSKALMYAEKGLAIANNLSADRHTDQYLELLEYRAYALTNESRFAEAIDCFEELVGSDEHFLVTNGEMLLTLLLRRGQRQHLERAEEIINTLQTYDEDLLPSLPWLVLLYRLITKRDESVINVALANAMRTLPHVGLVIADLHAGQTSYTFPHLKSADEEANLETIHLARICWPVYPEAVKRLRKMLQAR